MISEVYTAFRAAGVDEEKAKLAAEALSSESSVTKSDIQKLERPVKGDLAKLEKELAVVKWGIGLLIAAELIPYLKTLFA
ncbi:TPA: integrase [Vibrio parahaemolyticus]|nr:integrase [Vibrio parahaemolyticus]HAV1545616.1 integrase [Vibrio parahaemolyticus]